MVSFYQTGATVRIGQIVWDLDDDPAGNVQHISEHGVTMEEVEEVLASANEILASYSSGLPIVFGWTAGGKYLAVIFEVVNNDPLIVYPITAYETTP